MIRYKIDVLQELRDRGYNQPVIRKRNLLAQSTLTKLKNGLPVSGDTINTICLLLRKQPGDIIEVVPTDEEKIKYF